MTRDAHNCIVLPMFCKWLTKEVEDPVREVTGAQKTIDENPNETKQQTKKGKEMPVIEGKSLPFPVMTLEMRKEDAKMRN